ncbi:Protein CBG03969 [Caenorhabditis briggsae]|uniref:Protein CBG03969 n=1 Tax=Caenorhabditis briggsae TaxID=6238 RepID=A8WVV6_CAEBR|nr:Protein CBG03969 [Caenorhabditis briggsae]CAP24769.1 Protein CBG03969 [Caenorhabditis briggsae]
MDHFNSMSRDDLRKEVIKLLDIMSGGVKSKRILKSQQLKSMSTPELLTFIREHLQVNQAEIRTFPNVPLKEIFPYDDLIFSDYKETRKGIQKKDSQKSENFAVRSETKELCVGEDREEWYHHACQELMMNMENLQSRGSDSHSTMAFGNVNIKPNLL